MEQKLPNATIAIVLSILGLLCCCFYGVPGLLLGGIALILVNQDEKKYRIAPEQYSNYGTVKTAKILAIISIVLGALMLAYMIYTIMEMGGIEAAMEESRRVMEEMGFEE